MARQGTTVSKDGASSNLTASRTSCAGANRLQHSLPCRPPFQRLPPPPCPPLPCSQWFCPEMPEWDMEKYRFYVDLPGDFWEKGELLMHLRATQGASMQVRLCTTMLPRLASSNRHPAGIVGADA